MPANKVTFNSPFSEQLAYFKQKLNLPTDRYDDILKAAHDRAFIVAGAANADLLNDLRQAMQRAIEKGSGLETFRKDFQATVLKHGWTGWTGEGTAAGQAWRTRVIYQTNMSTSYAAGRWAQLTNPDLLAVRPYWRYIHSDSVIHPRPLHLSWDGLVLKYDHPFWLTHFAPNGWGCECRVMAVDAKEHAKAAAAGRDAPPAGWDQPDAKTGAPAGIDKGWDYAPGANAKTPLQDLINQKLLALDAPIGAAMSQALQPALKQEQKAAYQAFLGDAAKAAPTGRRAAVGAIDPATVRALADSQRAALASAAVTVQDNVIAGNQVAQALTGTPLAPADWARLLDVVSTPEQILWDAGRQKLIYVVSSDSGTHRLAIEIDALFSREAGNANTVAGGLRVAMDAIERQIQAGNYTVVK